MDKAALQRRLRSTTKLILGDVAETVPQFMQTDFAPIGFISFDLDFYSSTKAALQIFDLPDQKLLPRVFCYFDDIIGNDDEIMSEFVGELLAISEYNTEHEKSKIDLLRGLRFNRIVPATWPSMVYIMHRFDHGQYATYLFPEKERQYQPVSWAYLRNRCHQAFRRDETMYFVGRFQGRSSENVRLSASGFS